MIIVDAYNVLHLPDAAAAGADLDLSRLCSLIGASRYARERVLVVCDGVPGPALGLRPRPGGVARGRVGGMEVVFSGSERSADDEIEERLRAGAGAGVTIVSDDRRLRRAAGRAGARSLPSTTFLAHLLVDGSGRAGPRLPRFSKDIPLDPYSVAHWLAEFGVEAPPLAGIRDGPKPRHKHGHPRAAPGIADLAPPSRAGTPAGDVKPSGTEERAAPPPLPVDRAPRTEPLADDPIIREALEAWKGRLSLEDLDMRRWLDGRT